MRQATTSCKALVVVQQPDEQPHLDRRTALATMAKAIAAGAAAGAALAVADGASRPARAACIPDPIFALIEEHKALALAHAEACEGSDVEFDESGEVHIVWEVDQRQKEACDACNKAGAALFRTRPTTLAGAAALLRWFEHYNKQEGDIYADLTREGDWVKSLHVTLADALDKMAGAS